MSSAEIRSHPNNENSSQPTLCVKVEKNCLSAADILSPAQEKTNAGRMKSLKHIAAKSRR